MTDAQQRSEDIQQYCLLVISLVHITTTNVYCVIPDDHYPTNDSCNTLQYYLNNSEKYFSSHTQIQFMPGRYHLHRKHIVNNVTDFSIIGSEITEIVSTTLHCSTSANLVIIAYVNNVSIKNLVMEDCEYDYYDDGFLASINIFKYFNITIHHSVLTCENQLCGLLIFNALGYLHKVTTCQLHLFYNDTHAQKLISKV